MLHWLSTPTSGMKITERLASSAKDDRLAHMLCIWSKSIRLDVCLSNSISLFILTSYSSKAKGSFHALCLTLNNDNAAPHTVKPSPVPWTESLFSVSRAWHERKDTVTGTGNHEKLSCHLQAGSVRSQGETSLTLFLLTVHHFVCKIALAGLRLQSQPRPVVIWRLLFL